MDNAVPYIVQKLEGDLIPKKGDKLTLERPIRAIFSEIDREQAMKDAKNARPSLVVVYNGSFSQSSKIEDATMNQSFDRATFAILICIDKTEASKTPVHMQLANIRARVEIAMTCEQVEKNNSNPTGRRMWFPTLPDELKIFDTDQNGEPFAIGEQFQKKPFSKGIARSKFHEGNLIILPLIYTIPTVTNFLGG